MITSTMRWPAAAELKEALVIAGNNASARVELTLLRLFVMSLHGVSLSVEGMY